MLKPRPWWLAFIQADTWVTLSPHIYYPVGTPWPESWTSILAHENVHLNQQASGLTWWLVRYLLSKKFRDAQEAEAEAAEAECIQNDRQHK